MAVNIRNFVLQAHSLDELVALSTLTGQAVRFLEAAVAGLNVWSPAAHRGPQPPATRPAHPHPRLVERRRAEGKTDREIKRFLKRYTARKLYRRLKTPPSALDAA